MQNYAAKMFSFVHALVCVSYKWKPCITDAEVCQFRLYLSIDLDIHIYRSRY